MLAGAGRVRVRPRRAGPAVSGLRHDRDFRLFWFGQTTSRFGSTITTVALPLVAVTVLDASTLQIALLQAAAWLPWLVIGLPAGAFTTQCDRLSSRTVTDARCRMTVGRFSKLRQNRYSSSVERSIVIALTTSIRCWPPVVRINRSPNASYKKLRPVRQR